MVKIGSIELPEFPLLLAPMEDVSDPPFRALCKEQGADVVYTDSWMSYHIPKDQEEQRIAKFMPYQVNSALMAHAKPDAVFMNCLPAIRGCDCCSKSSAPASN